MAIIKNITSRNSKLHWLLLLISSIAAPNIHAGSILTCHNPLATPVDQTITADGSGTRALLFNSDAIVTSTVLQTYSYYSPAIPSYLGSVEATSSVYVSALAIVPPGSSFQATATLSASESFVVSGYSGSGTIEIPFFTVLAVQAPNDPAPTCSLMFQTITKTCTGSSDSIVVPFSAGETLTLSFSGTVQATGFFNSANYFQDDIFAIYPPTIRDSTGAILADAGLQLVGAPEPTTISLSFSALIVGIVISRSKRARRMKF